MTNKKKAYYFQEKSGLFELKEAMGEAYAEAYQKAYSVVEIARFIGVQKCHYIHAQLVKQGMMAKAKTGRLPKGLVPEGLAPYLSARGLTFAKWVAGRDLDPKTVLTDVKAGNGPGLEAIRIDFPGLYKKLTGADACLHHIADIPPLDHVRKDVIIAWDDRHDCYRCKVEGHDFAGYGNTPAEALRLAMWWYRGAESIERLRRLPDLRLERIGW